MVLMGGLNIDYQCCSNTKWLYLVQLFDLKQLIYEPTRITMSSSIIIDHVYTTNPEHITECFGPSYAISDHFPVCFSRKIGCKISKHKHITKSFRCFKNFNEVQFLRDLATDLEPFGYILPDSDINEDFAIWLSAIQSQLDRHAPLKPKRVKTNNLSEWYTQEILETRKLRDSNKKTMKLVNI